MTARKHPHQSDRQLRVEMKAAAKKMWDEANIEVSPHLANAIRRVAQSEVDPGCRSDA